MDYQQPNFYRFSEDSIWLANTAAKYCKGSPKTLLDIGSGCGVVGIEASNKIESIKSLTLLEPQKEFLSYLKQNQNLLRENVNAIILNSNIESMPRESFDLIVSNPPYFQEGSGRASDDFKKQKCRTFENIDFRTFFEKAISMLNKGGEFLCLARLDNPDVKKTLDDFKEVGVLESKDQVAILYFFNE